VRSHPTTAAILMMLGVTIVIIGLSALSTLL
jgi:hypothetical protein